ncbi:hypothetical protein O9992_01655 [Vibrio lentus]|nr:hypothetical protein [Vibrio lentus]
MYGLHGAEYVKPSTLLLELLKGRYSNLLVSIIDNPGAALNGTVQTTATHTCTVISDPWQLALELVIGTLRRI